MLCSISCSINNTVAFKIFKLGLSNKMLQLITDKLVQSLGRLIVKTYVSVCQSVMSVGQSVC